MLGYGAAVNGAARRLRTKVRFLVEYPKEPGATVDGDSFGF